MGFQFKKLLEKMAGKKAPGPSPSFSIFHILRALELIAKNTIGRSSLADELSVGEGVVRTIINRLKEAGLITTSRRGCNLTSKGVKVWEEYRNVFRRKVDLGESELTLADHNSAVLIKNRGGEAGSGMEQRDAAIMVGGRGGHNCYLPGGTSEGSIRKR